MPVPVLYRWQAVVLGIGRRPRRGGVGVDNHVGEREGVKRTSQKWGGGAEKNITFREMREMLCLH